MPDTQGATQMLVLTRKEDEAICIGNDIIITITEIRPGRVRVGIEAPSTIMIWRKELPPKKLEDDNGTT